MPTPDGREWFNSDKIAQRMIDKLGNEVPQGRAAFIRALLTDAFSGLYGIEFKILRLTEKLKDSIEQGAFGPLFVDAGGNPVAPQNYDPDAGHQTTQAYEIWRAFKDIYTLNVLEQFDEDGNLLSTPSP